MNMDARPDSLMHALSSLPEAAPDAAHSVRVRARCHRVMVRRAERTRRGADRGTMAAGAFCAVYAAALLRALMLFYGV